MFYYVSKVKSPFTKKGENLVKLRENKKPMDKFSENCKNIITLIENQGKSKKQEMYL